jgi:hypothetical protein
MTITTRRLACAAALVSACASTAILSTWKEPGVGQVAFHKVLVLAPGRDPSIRRAAEDELVSRITRVLAVPSYTLIPDNEMGSQEAIRARAVAAGFDGAVVMRVVSVNRQATWVPGSWVGPYYAFGGWPAYDPGFVQVDTQVRVETNVYSLPDDKLLWASGKE